VLWPEPSPHPSRGALGERGGVHHTCFGALSVSGVEGELTKYAIITGAGGSIGSATARRLARDGWALILVDRDAPSLRSLADELGSACLSIEAFDVREAEAWRRMVARMSKQAKGHVSLLFNNAGIYAAGNFSCGNLDDYKEIIDTNLLGVVNGIMACYPMLKETPGAQVINNSSFMAYHGFPGAAVYAATKAAVRNLTETLNIEFERDDIWVSNISPAFVSTNFFGGSDEARNTGFIQRLRDCGASLVSPEDVAETVWKVVYHRSRSRPVGWQAWAYAALARFAPALARRQSKRAAECFFEADTP
jgi:NADP-dependent 3-hydroxy acid dehydrogenase YdfG